MTRFTKTLIAATALIALAGNAHAGDTFSVSFNIDESASIEQNYKNFEIQAQQSCRSEIKRFESTQGRLPAADSNRFRRSCKKELVEKAVAATKNTVLIAYHRDVTNPGAAPTKLASAK